MKKGLVSIITPMYKGAAFVGKTIESVLKQSYTDWEMIIVDVWQKGSISLSWIRMIYGILYFWKSSYCL